MAAIRDGITPYAEALSEAENAGRDPAGRLVVALRGLAGAAIERRTLGVLWQRDARNLPADEQRSLRGRLRATTDRLARLIHAARPELDADQSDALAWCTMGALVSLGFHAITLPRPAFDDAMFDIVTAVNATELADLSGAGRSAPRPASVAPMSRRDALITAATELIADRGFAATRDRRHRGRRRDRSGPSVYARFPTKQAILVAAIQRATAILLDDLTAVLASDDPAPVRFARVVDSYIHLANRDRSISGRWCRIWTGCCRRIRRSRAGTNAATSTPGWPCSASSGRSNRPSPACVCRRCCSR